MTLRIERDSSRGFTVLKLIGQIRSEDVMALAAQLNGEFGVVLDLDELALVDAAVVRFLSATEDAGVELLNCPPYIREWMTRERE
jgi:anti-anti-sigma regulatory factor